ncbi:MAG TPA: acyl-CoA carboxylase subunit beta, partial [Solirubrobacteraceae bacterium]
MTLWDELRERDARALSGGSDRAKAAVAAQGKLGVRDRLALLLDDGSFIEDGLLARTEDEGLPADAVVCGIGTVSGRPVVVIANDPTVKAGAWGRQTSRKYLRAQDTALTSRCPLIYLVDSAGARLDEQFDLFIDRHHAGRIFYQQALMSGRIPQIALVFGPSPAGAAYVPAFCEAVVMVDGNASAFLGSPRMVEMATGEIATAEEMGGARMHCTVSGLGDQLVRDDAEAIAFGKRYLEVLPQHWEDRVPPRESVPPAGGDIEQIVPEAQNKPYDVHELLAALLDEGSLLEHRTRFAKELVTCFARLDGRAVGILANQSKHKGGVLTSDSADKGAQFVSLCDAYGIPLVFLADTPGFMVGTQVERAGIIRHGAKLLLAIANATVPRITCVVRKSYGAGYLAMSGATFEPDSIIALPTAKMAIMGPEPAVNAIYANRIGEI